MTDRRLIALAAVLGLLAVAAGAFGAHALAGRDDGRAVQLFETASRYQMWHALALLGLAASGLDARWVGRLFVAGIVLFCGSLYALGLGAPRGIGLITPFGGVAFLAGWAVLAVTALRRGEARP